MPRPAQITPDGVVEAIREAETPFVSTGELAEYFDVTRQAVRDQREQLADDPRIEVGKVSNNTVFYISDGPQLPETTEQGRPPGQDRGGAEGDTDDPGARSEAAEGDTPLRPNGRGFQFERKHDSLTVVESTLLAVVVLLGSATLLAVVGGLIDQLVYNWFPFDLLAADGFVVAAWVAGTMMLVATVALLAVVVNVADRLQYHVEEILGVTA